MANVNGILGSDTGTNQAFVPGTRVWAGGVLASSIPAWDAETDYTTASVVRAPGFPNTVFYSPSADITGDATNTFQTAGTLDVRFTLTEISALVPPTINTSSSEMEQRKR